MIDHVTLGPLTGIAAVQPLGPSNVVGLLQGDDAVILRGAYKIGAAIHTHWMLATSYTVDGSGAINAIVADDPWTGKQVRIHPTTKAVVSPAGFPLAGFKVNGYQSVTFVQPRT